MSSEASPAPRDAGHDWPGARRATTLGTFAVLLVIAALLAWRGGALASELGAYEDEPAHVATALMVRDWLAAPTHPVRFAEQYYTDYPKVAVGQWPPVYHGLLGLWMFVAGVGSASIVLFSVLLSAATGTVLARALAPHIGAVAAMAAGAVLVALPLVQELAGCAMTELPVALFSLLAVVAFARYVEAPCPRAAVAFGWWASLAILTKGSGLALALLPSLTLLLTGRWRLALRPDLWLAAVVVGVLAGPWYAVALPISQGTWAAGPTPTLEYVLRCAVYYPREVVGIGGALFAGLALVGASTARPVGRLFGDLVREEEGRLASALVAWLVSLAALHAFVPSSLEARHLVPAAPALVALAFLGARALLRVVVLSGHAPRRGLREATLLSSLVLAACTPVLDVVQKRWSGFDGAASLVLEDALLDGTSVLVASGAAGEGLGVLGFALNERPRRTRQVLRASKVLADAGWLGQDYRTRHADAASLRTWLAEVPVTVVLFDRSTPPRHRWPHLAQLEEALGATRTPGEEQWQLAGAYDVVRDGVRHAAALEVWVHRGHAHRRPRRLGLDEVLGRVVPRF